MGLDKINFILSSSSPFSSKLLIKKIRLNINNSENKFSRSNSYYIFDDIEYKYAIAFP
jgi:hypothetical protein